MKRCYHCMYLIEQEKAQTCPHCGQSLAAQPVAPSFLRPGTILQDKYLVGYPLGSGGFGNTYIGWNRFLDRRVAIKEFYPKQIIGRTREGRNVTMLDEVSQSRFRKGLSGFLEEAKNLAAMKDIPGVVEVQAFFEENDTGYMVMEYLEGMDVKTALKKAGGRMDYATSREIMLSVLYTLREIHRRGLLHRDIAPDNIFLTKDGAVKLIDFGSAKYETALANTQSQVILKPGYTPLEQYSRNGKQGPYTDLYASAATFYRMLTGQKPIPAIERLEKDGLIPPSDIGVKMPEQAELGIMVCLNVNAKFRLQNADELIEALDGKEFVPVQEIQEIRDFEPKEKLTDRIWNLLKKKKIAAVLSGCAVVVVVLAGVLLFGHGSSDDEMQASSVIVMPDLSHMTIEEAQKELDSLQEEAEKQGISVEIQAIEANNTEFVLDESKHGTIANQNIETGTVLYDESKETQQKIDGLKRGSDNGISGAVQCTVYSNKELRYSDLSNLNAYEMAKKLGIDTEDAKHFVGQAVEGTNYYDLITLQTPSGEITGEMLKKEKNQNKSIAYQKGKMVIHYSNIPFLYFESLPDFQKEYGTLAQVPMFDTYIWKDEKTMQASGEQKRLEEVYGMVDGEYCAIAANASAKGYHAGDIIEQTIPAGTKLDTSHVKLSEPMLKVIGEELLYNGKTGTRFQQELKEKWGENITIVAGSGGVMSQPVTGVTLTDADGEKLEYFRKGQAVTVTLSLQAVPAPQPQPVYTQPSYSYSEPSYSESSYSGGGSSGGGGYSGDESSSSDSVRIVESNDGYDGGSGFDDGENFSGGSGSGNSFGGGGSFVE